MESALDPSHPHQLVAGRRLVRRLGSGRRWTAYGTVRTGDEPPVAARQRRPALANDAVLLRATADAAERSLWRRAAILSRLDHPHILRLLDVAEDVDGLPCLLVERLSGGTLAGLLRRRESIAPGEAVTILAPLAEAVQAAHLAGIRHGSISPTTVVFAAEGRPVLAGWSDAVAVVDASGRPVSSAAAGSGEAFQADWQALAELVDGVLRSTSLAHTTPFASWVAQISNGVAEHELANRFQQRIHALARPLPVLLEPADERPMGLGAAVRASLETAAGPAERLLGPTTRRAARESRRRRRRTRVGTTGQRDGLLARAWTRRTTAGDGSRRATALTPNHETAPDGPPSRRLSRRRLTVGAAVAGVSLTVVALLVLPVDTVAPDPQAVGLTEPMAETHDASPVPAPHGDAGTSAPDDPLTGADPVLAAARLVTLRNECRTPDAVEACVAAYAEHASPFSEAEATGGSIGVIESTELRLVDRQGDAAILRGTAVAPDDAAADQERQPVTLLVVRGETGWRLREVFTAG